MRVWDKDLARGPGALGAGAHAGSGRLGCWYGPRAASAILRVKVSQGYPPQNKHPTFLDFAVYDNPHSNRNYAHNLCSSLIALALWFELAQQ